MHEGKAAGIARDNKALVHIYNAVVQRPSKSWVNVQYEDNDWEKVSNITLTFTTYQLIKVKKLSENQECIATLNSIPGSKSRLSGPGISIVKMSYFQKESIFRHLNKTLYLMYPISCQACSTLHSKWITCSCNIFYC